jgi:hypothetical protein
MLPSKGVKFAPRKQVIQKAPEELSAAPSEAEALSMKPSPVTTAVVREMFGARSAVAKAPAPPAPRPPKPDIRHLDKETRGLVQAEARELKGFDRQMAKMRADGSMPPVMEVGYNAGKAAEAAGVDETMSTRASIAAQDAFKSAISEGMSIDDAKAAGKAAGAAVYASLVTGYRDEALNQIAAEYAAERKKDPYTNPAPAAYVPESRRGFSDFIKLNYKDFVLNSLPVAPGDKYPYQKFVREYIRQASPYRGVLVYHGLGSGKTCTAIAASEALFSTSNKKIIVMTPFSLRKNFLREVSFCGFRHFRLHNHWERLDPRDPMHALFATEVLGLTPGYVRKAKSIWVPDFRRDTSNYDTLDGGDQNEIRAQITFQLVWDKDKNPGGRIRFINYNGISAAKLKEIACSQPDFFDNAVVVVDEIHNLVRLMQGTIDPYLIELKGVKRKVPPEKVDAGHWAPSLCNISSNYKRGYLFYRLLLGAQNSKIIGLSGTPLINFPEELGILANILHGYHTVMKGPVSSELSDKARDLLLAHPYTDFVQVKAGTFTVSLLPFGVRKISNDKGVERIPLDEKSPSLHEMIDRIKADLMKLGVTTPIQVEALPVLPPFHDEFRDTFLERDGVHLKNKMVLSKRLSGLISYYKGSRQDLMPRIERDEVVRVPMSAYAQSIYSLARLDEIKIESSKKKEAAGGLAGIWAEVYEIGKAKQSTNYRMGSRQACNFAFPPGITRPRPSTLEEQEEEGVDDEDIIETVVEPHKPEETFDLEDEVAASPKELKEEDRNAANSEEDSKEDFVQYEKAEEDFNLLGFDAPAFVVTGAKKSLAQLRAEKEARDKAPALRCKGSVAGETYRQSLDRAKECLRTKAGDALVLVADPNKGLASTSPKFAAMLTRIKAAPGSSLVYSQFLDMEGIGIFQIALDLNGFAPIKIDLTPLGPVFTKETIASLKRGPDQMRYMTFSGGEPEEVRRYSLDVFNTNMRELPASLRKVLEESGFTDNKKGQLCRVFCITSAGAEGLSLKNVRAVHIMEPYWNDVRLKQVKGRAVRIGSHLELPEDQRNVSIYTYLSVFGPEAQVIREGPLKIDQTIRQRDHLERKDSLSVGLPIPDQSAMYVLTSDERLFVISERKKAVIQELENVMKGAAVDCTLNQSENRDGTFECISLPGKTGDFLYHPDIAIDKSSEGEFKQKRVAEAVQGFDLKLRGVVYKAIDKVEDGVLVGFTLYDPADLKRPLGSAGERDGRPAPPFTIF